MGNRCHVLFAEGVVGFVSAAGAVFDDDARLLGAVNRGEFVLGFRNRDLRGLLFGELASADVRRRQVAKVTRMIRMLRAHGFVHKVPKTDRYTFSPKGCETILALLAGGEHPDRNAPFESIAKDIEQYESDGTPWFSIEIPRRRNTWENLQPKSRQCLDAAQKRPEYPRRNPIHIRQIAHSTSDNQRR